MKTSKAIIRLASNNSQNLYSLFTSQIYQLKIKCKDGGSYFYKNKKYRRLQIEKKLLFSYFILEIPNFSHMGFFREWSMFRWSIPLINDSSWLLAYLCQLN